MSHTPGPWAYDADSKEVFSSDEGHGCGWIASVDGNDSNGCPLPESMRLANARLIAAAPELLRACKLFLREYTRNDGAVLCYCCDPHFEPSPGETKCDICVFVAAIAKAEGRDE